MRGDDPQQAAMFSYISPEERVPREHPLRLIRAMVYVVLKELSPQFDLPFRWFVGLNMDDPIWAPSPFSKNREGLLAGDVAHAFFDQVLAQARERALLSDEHFTVGGTLIEA